MRLTIIALFLLIPLCAEARVDTLWVQSSQMDKKIGTTVILPEDYDTALKAKYPVIYILHGAGGDYGNWLRRVPQLEQYSTHYGFIFVCPDGGKTSWYLDSPVDPQIRYESYIIDELVPQIDAKYRTSATVQKRAITGLSMGGHGALYLALKNPQTFQIAGSMSGGVDLRPFTENWDLPMRLGKYENHKQNWENNSVVVLAERAQPESYNFIIDCGTEDFFLDTNRNLDAILNEHGYDYEYSERKGAHNWPYWRVSIVRHLEFFKKEFSSPNQ